MTIGRKSRAVLIIIGSLLVILTICVWVLADYGIKYINENGEEYLGRKVHVDDINFNLFNATIGFKSLTIYEKNGEDEFIGIKRCKVNLNLRAIIDERYIIDKLLIEGLDVKITQSQGLFNFQDIIDKFKKQDTSIENNDTVSSSDDFVYAIKKIYLKESSIKYLDSYLPIPIELSALNFAVPTGIYSDARDLEGSLSFILNNAGGFTTKLTYHKEMSSFEAVLNIGDFDLKMIEPFIEKYIYLGSLAGAINSEISLRGFVANPANIDVSGSISIANLSLLDTKQTELAGFEKLAINVDSLNPVNNQYSIKSVSLNKPTGVFQLFKDNNNFSALLRPTSSTTDTNLTIEALKKLADDPSNLVALLAKKIQETIKAYEASNLKIDHISVSSGRFEYYDHTLLKPFHYEISNFNLSTKAFYFNSDSVMVTMNTDLKNNGYLEAVAILYPKNRDDLTLDISIVDMDLVGISPYFHYYLGHEINSGILSFKTHVLIKDTQLTSPNHVLIKGMELADKDKHEYAAKLPVKTAIAALKDRHGIIELDIPVEGNLGDPNYKLGKAIVKILKNLVVKAAAAPAKAVGSKLIRKKEKRKFLKK